MSAVCSTPTTTPTKPITALVQPGAWLRLADDVRVHVLLLLGLCGFLFFYGLGAGQLWRTEGLRAILAAEFLNSGNWLVPRLYGEPLFTKPPGMYAAIALASWPFGEVSEWTARLPSALAATATVLLFYWYFARQLGSRAGWIAALILPMSPLWLEKGTSAEIDMLQLAWVTGSILFFLRALESVEETEAGRAWPWWLASLGCVAGGVLTKWTAPAFFYLTVVPLLWWRGRLRLLWCRQHLAAAGLAAAVCLGWAIAAASLEGWEPLLGTVKREALQRLLPGYTPRPYPWTLTLLHPFRLLAIGLPWSMVALLALRPSFARCWDERGRRLLQAMHCWTWPSVLFWSVLPEHNPRYGFPLVPGLSGLAALVVIAWVTGRRRWPIPPVGPRQLLMGTLVCWLAFKLVFVHAMVPARHPGGGPRLAGQMLAALVPPGCTLYIICLKDECVAFYYGRPVRRVEAADRLPTGWPVYCVLTAAEWQRWDGSRRAEVVQQLYDGQGNSCVLVRVSG